MELLVLAILAYRVLSGQPTNLEIVALVGRS
jgi:hypothetical protein